MKIGDLVRFTESGVKHDVVGVTVDFMESGSDRWRYFKVMYQLFDQHECQWVMHEHLEVINESR